MTYAGFIFEHLARDSRFDNVTRRPGYSRGRSGFLPVAIEGMSFSKGLFLKEKRTLEKSASSREYVGSSVTLSRRGAKS